jgi:hypothetical protein
LKLYQFENVHDFIRKVGDFLEKNEAANNLLLGLIYSLQQGVMSGEKLTDTFMGAVDDVDGNLVLVVLINPINLIVCGEGREIDNAIHHAVTYLYKSGRDIPGIVGPTAIANQFAIEWASKKKMIPFVKMNQRIYQLDQVNPMQLTSGIKSLTSCRRLQILQLVY